MSDDAEAGSLLAVDLGLSTGLALYGGDGRLRWYRSQHFANAATLRRAAHRILRENTDIVRICIEGGGSLGLVWEREAAKRQIRVVTVAAEQWRQRLLYPRDQRSGAQAKHKADDLARRVIDWSGAPRPTSLRHDASEAILIGLWGVIDAGWLGDVPANVR